MTTRPASLCLFELNLGFTSKAFIKNTRKGGWGGVGKRYTSNCAPGAKIMIAIHGQQSGSTDVSGYVKMLNLQLNSVIRICLCLHARVIHADVHI